MRDMSTSPSSQWTSPDVLAKDSRALWIVLAVVVIASFAALLYFGGEIYQMAPPIPSAVVTTNGDVIFTDADVRAGQDVWRSIG